MRVASTPLALLLFGLCLSPLVPLVLSWVRAPGLTDRPSWASLCIATLSSLWLIAGALFPITLGRYYTDLRFTIIYTNLLVMLICATTAFLRKSRLRVPLGIGCLMQALVWFYAAAVNVTV